MTQQQLDNMTEFNPHVKRYALTDSQGSTEIVFFPQSPDSELGKPQLDYQGSEGRFTFIGDKIHQQQSSLGLLITVVLKPDLDAGQLNLTLALPPINLAGKKGQEFETIAVKTKSQGHVIDSSGATLTYRVLMLKGVAQAVIMPAETDSEERAKNLRRVVPSIKRR
jgi:hypothetical protein